VRTLFEDAQRTRKVSILENPENSFEDAHLFSKMRSFRCASCKRVRIFEGICGLFEDAHFRKPVRIFEPGAHLRNQGAALDPVPLARKVAHPLVAASFALLA